MTGPDRLREEPALAAHVLADAGQRITRFQDRTFLVGDLKGAIDA